MNLILEVGINLKQIHLGVLSKNLWRIMEIETTNDNN